MRALGRFERRCYLVGVTDAVLARVRRPFPVEPIRTLDAVHLATTELLGEPPPLIEAVPRCRMRKRDLVRSYALIGAQARLAELDRERVDIFETFPELDPRPPAASATTPVRKRRKMSDAAKQAISLRMKKYWGPAQEGTATLAAKGRLRR